MCSETIITPSISYSSDQIHRAFEAYRNLPVDIIVHLPLPTWTREHYPNLSRMPPYKLPTGTTIVTHSLTKPKANKRKPTTSSPPFTQMDKDVEELQIALKRSREDAQSS